MASSNKIVVIDLGSSTLKLGVFQAAQGSITLLHYSINDLGLDPNKEQDRFPFILEALQKALAEKGIKAENAYCSISGQFVFTRFVKLPPVAPDQIDQMVIFEAQQNVPFPINEVVWDYQLLGGKGAAEVEAVIVAVKSDLVEQANTAFSMNQLKLAVVDVAPLTLVNAFRYNYPDHKECVLIIDIGAKTTNLVFIDNNKVFCRVIPIAGHMISQNISNEFQEPYVSSELLKKGKGFVGLGGAYADPADQTAARISKIARSVFSKLHAEITRSISFYRNQQNGSAPKLILLAGGAAAMPYADLFFKEKLNSPVEFFNPFKNINLAPSVDRAKLVSDAYLLGPVSGLGLRLLHDVPMEVNLVPLSVKHDDKEKGQLPYFVTAVLVWALLFVLAAGAYYMKAAKVGSEVEALRQDLAIKQTLSAAIQKSTKDVAKQKQELLAISKLLRQRDYWPNIIDLVIKNASSFTGLWITKLDMSVSGNPIDVLSSSPKKEEVPRVGQPRPRAQAGAKAAVQEDPLELNIRGFYEATQPFGLLNNFTTALEDTKLFDKVEIISRESSDNDQVALEFYVRAIFKPEAKKDLMP